jgi:hypothetical protein
MLQYVNMFTVKNILSAHSISNGLIMGVTGSIKALLEAVKTAEARAVRSQVPDFLRTREHKETQISCCLPVTGRSCLHTGSETWQYWEKLQPCVLTETVSETKTAGIPSALSRLYLDSLTM